jgi:PAS domain S-box-containing protein
MDSLLASHQSKEPSERIPCMPAEQSWGNEEQFRLLIEGAMDYAIFLIDPRGHVVSWNPGAERILGYKQDEIVGQPLSRIFTSEDIEAGEPEQELQTAVKSGRSEDERWQLRKDGGRFWAQGVLTALHDEQGKIRGFAKVLRDRTDMKELQETLRHRAESLIENDERKNQFLAVLVHELRNPLAPILNALQLIRHEGQGKPALEKPIRVIERQVRHVQRLVEDVLDVIRVGAGKLRLRKERVELAGVVRQAVETTRPLVESRKHQLSLSLPAVPVWLDADPTRLVQILVNLLTNAAKYTDEGGQIALSADLEGNEVVLRVRDSGIGIPADVMPHIFDLFIQGDYSQRHAQGGLGIGLTLVRNLIHLHGGTIQARSEGPRKGSEFIVRLRAAKDQS